MYMKLLKGHEQKKIEMYYLKRTLVQKEMKIREYESRQSNMTSTEMQTLADPKIPMLEHELKNTEITNDNLREELIKVNEELQQLKNKDAERKMDGLGSSLVE